MKKYEANKKIECKSTGSPVSKAKIIEMREHLHYTVSSDWKGIHSYMPKCMNSVQPFSLNVLSF